MVTLKGYTASYAGKSTDTKPTDVDINAILHELDTDKYYYFDGSDWNEIPNSGGGGGGGFTPTDAQLAAMNSGITAEDVTQIGTNENNISSCKKITDRIVMDDTEDTLLFVQATQPTGTIPEGSIWINTAVSNA